MALENKYRTICKKLESRIKKGEYKDRLPGVYRLAEEFGVSHITISKAIKELSERGFVTVLGTKGAFVTERKSDRPKSNLICLVGGSGEYSAQDMVIKEMVKAAEKAGYGVLTLGVSSLNILRDIAFISAIQVDGYIFFGAALDMEIARNLRFLGIPFVSMTGMPEETGIDWVDHDNFESVSKVFKYLYRLGHRRIAYMGFKNTVDYHARKVFESYKGCMKELGIYDKRYYLAEKTNFEYGKEPGAQVYEKCADDIIKKAFKLKESPTAAFVCSTNLARAIKEKLEKRSVKVPEDFSIVAGFFKHRREMKDEFFTYLEVNEIKRGVTAFKTLKSLMDESIERPVRKFIERKFFVGKSTREIALGQIKK
jgi:LacI family transcriptional regulator